MEVGMPARFRDRSYLDDVARSGRALVYVSIVERELRSLAVERLLPPGKPDLDEVLEAANRDAFARATKLWTEAKSRDRVTRGDDDSVLAFYTLGDLRDLLYRNWALVADFFGDRQSFQRVFGELESTRNSVAHSRVVSTESLTTLERICGGLLERAFGTDSSQVASRYAPLDFVERLFAERHRDVVAVYVDRGAVQRDLPLDQMMDNAKAIDACGLSLNAIAQGISRKRLVGAVSRGLTARILLLDPDGSSILEREREEGYGDEPVLRSLTRVNLAHLRSIGAQCGPGQFGVRTIDETIRINYIAIDGELALVQHYLPRARGVDSPTIVLRNTADGEGLYEVYQSIFESLWERGR